MENNYDGPYKDRLIEIDNRIEDLKAHISMWSKAGSGNKSMQAIGEIESLKEEKSRILNGSQARIDEIQDKIRELQELKRQCKMINFIKKMNLNKEINKFETEKASIFRK